MVRVEVLSSLVLGTVVVGSLSSSPASTALPSATEVHAPRIPGPPPKTVPGPPGSRPEAEPLASGWTSSNWSGYALTGTGFSSVTGNWRVPRVQTPKKGQLRTNKYSASWVGIDGFANRDLIQAGTEQDWVRRTAVYGAWWEILPAAETPIFSLTIHPGDAMSVTITQGGSHRWTISLADTTTHQSFTTVQSYTGPGASAEWIQEAPTLGQRVANLAIDSNVDFDLGTVNGTAPELVLSDSGVMIKGQSRSRHPRRPTPPGTGLQSPMEASLLPRHRPRTQSPRLALPHGGGRLRGGQEVREGPRGRPLRSLPPPSVLRRRADPCSTPRPSSPRRPRTSSAWARMGSR